MPNIRNPYVLNTGSTIVDLHNALLERLNKVEALVQLGILDNVMEVVNTDVGNFLCILSDLLREIKELYEKLPTPVLKDCDAA